MKHKLQLLEILESRIAPAFAVNVNLALLSGANGFRLDGNLDDDHAGTSVADAGDVNGDGFHDIIIGAPDSDVLVAGGGAAYVVFGDESGFSPTLDLGTLNGTNGFRIEGSIGGAKLGKTVAGAGDVNGDGFDDVIVGAPGANINANANSGIAYVIFGKSGSFGQSFPTNQISGVNGFAVFGASPNDNCGTSVAGAGDINGDGYGDVIVGASGFDVPKQGGGVESGAGGAAVIYGHAGAFISFTNFSQVGLGSVNGGFRIEGVKAGAGAGSAVGGAGDFNGDGFDDVVIGAPSSDNNAGSAYVIYGKAGAFASPVSLASAKGTGGFQVNGIAAGDLVGAAVSSAGDINHDGLSDVIVGGYGADPNGGSSGESYVIFGRPATFANPISAASASLRIQGPGINGFAGYSVSGAGDLNGDGYDDLIIGVPGVTSMPGASYVVFGREGAFTTPVSLGSLDGTNGFKLSGLNIGDFSGGSVSRAGDVNGDGYDDLLIGAPNASHGVTEAGEAYVYFGSNGGNKVNIDATGHVATFTDADGDLVTVKVTKGTLSTNDFVLSGANSLGGSTLQRIDFAGHADLAKSSVTVSAKPQIINGTLHGDGLVNIGALDATGLPLGVVKIAGDLGRINATGNGALVPAVKSLIVNSIGVAGDSAKNAADHNNVSLLLGNVPSLVVKTNVQDATLFALKLGAVKIGGNLKDSRLIVSGDSTAQTAKDALALKSLAVRGDIDHSEILGGSSPLGGNADVQLGKILIGGDLTASNIVAGVTAGADGIRGTADDSLFVGGSALVASRIASLIVKGQALGTYEPGGHYAVSAEQFGTVRIGGVKVATKTLPTDQKLALGATGDLVLNIV